MSIVANMVSFHSFVKDSKEIEDAKISNLEKNIIAEFTKYIKTKLSEKKGRYQTKKTYMWDHMLLLKKRNEQEPTV